MRLRAMTRTRRTSPTQEANRMIRTLDRRLSIQIGGWWVHSPPSQLACADQTDGSRICWMYTRLPTQPAAAKR
jgi:hypothetical protein